VPVENDVDEVRVLHGRDDFGGIVHEVDIEGAFA
jgi:hypothetical protein